MRWWLNPFHLRDGIRGAYRLARKLGVPLIADLDPERIGFELQVPGQD